MQVTHKAKTVYQADCDEFDNHKTGFYATAAAAVVAFWAENCFSAKERKRVRVYTRARTAGTVLEEASWLATCGSPSPALGIKATARTRVGK